MSRELNDVIEEDRQYHPNCRYSVSSSRSTNRIYRNSQEETISKVIEQIQRHCPNERTTTIYSNEKSDSSDGKVQQGDKGSFFGSFFSPFSDNGSKSRQVPEPNLLDDQAIFGSLMQDMMKDFMGFGSQPQPNQRDATIPKIPRKGATQPSIPFNGEIVGPSESI